MSEQVSEAELDQDGVSHAVAALRAADPRPVSWAVVLLRGMPPAVVWANRDAVHLFGRDKADALTATLLEGPGRAGLSESLARLPAGASPRLERLRLTQGFLSRAVTATLVRLPDGPYGPMFALGVPSQGDAVGLQNALAGVPDHCPVAQADSPTAAAEPVAPTPNGPRRTVRLLWQTDPGHRVTRLTGGGAEAADAEGAGTSLEGGLAALAGAGSGPLWQALEARRTFSGLDVAWPLADGATAPAVLGGVPVMRGAAGFDGFRGFGLVELPAETGAPRPEGEHLPAASDPSTQDDESGPEAVQDLGPDPVDEHASSLTPDIEATGTALTVPPPDPMPAPAFTAKVVALRPHRWGVPEADAADGAPVANHAAETAAPAQVDQSDPPEDHKHLSPLERSALQEIARTLGAGLEPQAMAAEAAELAGEPETDPALAPLPSHDVSMGRAEDLPEAPAPERSALDAILAVTADPMLVLLEGRLASVSAALLDLSGYGSLAALDAAGGLAQLFGPEAATDAVAFLRAGPDRIVTSSGVDRKVRVVVAGGLADGQETLVAVVRPAEEAAVLSSPDSATHASVVDPRRLLDAVSNPVAIVDAERRIYHLNEAGLRLIGRDPASLEGAEVTSLLDPESQGVALGLLAAAGAGQNRPSDIDRSVEVSAHGRGGASIPLTMAARAVEADQTVVTLHDDTARRSLQRALADATHALLDERGLRSDFLAKVSHEIRTPLNAILGFTEVMLEERFGPIGNARYKDYLRDIHESGSQVMRLVSDLLDLSRMEAGRFDMSPAALDINRVINECVMQMQPTANRERIIMRQSLAPRLPAALVDERAFRQIMGGILSNAVRFNEPGGQVIVSTAMHEQGSVAIRVRDTGIGMSDEEISLAMEPFRQIATATGRNGSGLGLPLAKALVEANQASMTIRSRKSEGTLVEILLRAALAEPLRVPAE